uniref:Uncharacterized protein n=1 Tax=Macrostomum lignano TaxID=282301 RepID=A0A1I8J1V3_9PLAT
MILKACFTLNYKNKKINCCCVIELSNLVFCCFFEVF